MNSVCRASNKRIKSFDTQRLTICGKSVLVLRCLSVHPIRRAFKYAGRSMRGAVGRMRHPLGLHDIEAIAGQGRSIQNIIPDGAIHKVNLRHLAGWPLGRRVQNRMADHDFVL